MTEMIRNIAAAAALVMTLGIGVGAQTPPVQPKVQKVDLPPAVTLSAPDGVPEDVPNRPLTADEAAAIALRHQPEVAIARADVGAAQGRRQQARSDLLPNLEGNATYYNSDSNTPNFGSEGYAASAVVRQLIYDFNHTRDLARQAGAREGAASAALSAVQSDVVNGVKQAFYLYQEQQRLVAVNEAQLEGQQSHLASAKARLDAGMGLPADVVRAETEVANAAFNLNEARNAALIARTVLAQLMGIDPRTPIMTAEASEPPTPDATLEELTKQALAKRPEMRRAQMPQVSG
jgi:outer membrane protein TolC